MTRLKKETAIVGKVLSSALRLWLRSQVEEVEALEMQIDGKNRQVLRGYVPSVELNCTRAVYQGIHCRQIQLRGENIRINLGQVLRGQPLQLLEPVPVAGSLSLEAADLMASLGSSLLTSGLTDLLLTLLTNSGIDFLDSLSPAYQFNWQNIEIGIDKFTLLGSLQTSDSQTRSIAIRSGLFLVDEQTLRLAPISLEGLPELSPIAIIDELEIDLGQQVKLQQLQLQPGQLFCSGTMVIIPATEASSG